MSETISEAEFLSLCKKSTENIVCHYETSDLLSLLKSLKILGNQRMDQALFAEIIKN